MSLLQNIKLCELYINLAYTRTQSHHVSPWEVDCCSTCLSSHATDLETDGGNHCYWRSQQAGGRVGRGTTSSRHPSWPHPLQELAFLLLFLSPALLIHMLMLKQVPLREGPSYQLGFGTKDAQCSWSKSTGRSRGNLAGKVPTCETSRTRTRVQLRHGAVPPSEEL